MRELFGGTIGQLELQHQHRRNEKKKETGQERGLIGWLKIEVNYEVSIILDQDT